MANCALASIGSFISVSVAAPTTRDEAGYAALTYTKVGGTLTIPQFGGSSSPTSSTPLETGTLCKSQGPIDWGQLALNNLYIEDDAGHVILLDGLDGTNKGQDLSIEITYPNGAIRYTGGYVGAYTETPGAAGDNLMMDATLELNWKPVHVSAP